MSDRYLRTLLREAQQGQVPLQDYVAAALRVMPPEEVIDSLRGFDTESIRLAVKLVWIPAYAKINQHTSTQATLAKILDGRHAELVEETLRNTLRNRGILETKDWYLFAADCAEYVLPNWKLAYPDDDRPEKAIETTREFATGKCPSQRLVRASHLALQASHLANDNGEFSAEYAAISAAAYYASFQILPYPSDTALLASEYAELSALFKSQQAKIAWQAARLSDYLVGLSALPPPVINE